jgi:hypothetical protein
MVVDFSDLSDIGQYLQFDYTFLPRFEWDLHNLN